MTGCCGNPGCKRPFGLIRHSWHFEQFCSTKCREIYKRQLERNKAYWKWLYPFARTGDGRSGKLV